MLKDVCNCEFTKNFKLEADFSADPIWCNVCGCNFDIDEFPLTEDLKDELYKWTEQYKKTSVKEHNAIGQKLTEKVQKELGSEYKIVFIPQY